MATDRGNLWHENPFPLSPVVRLGPSADLGDPTVRAADSGNAHIRTPLVADLETLVTDYFVPPAAGGRRGRAIALVGEFGLGKSHALRRAYQLVNTQYHDAALWTVDEPAQDMGRLYRDRLRGPGDTAEGRQAFEELVRDYYAYVTAGWVGAQEDDPRRDTLREIAAGLRDRSLDPDKVVSALRYDPEVIHAGLRGTLGEITEHRRFATALALLLEPPFRRMVWQWLGGEEPEVPLRERGITEAIGPPARGRSTTDGIDRVFDALAVLGFLHGRVGTPYVLLLDSLEKVLDWPEETRRTFMDAFERLVNIYTSHGGLLVFCTSPRGLQALRASAHDRVVQLWASGLDEERTRELVAKYLAVGDAVPVDGADGSDRRPTGPFEEESLRLLHELSEGVPRVVLKTCRQAWQLSEDRDGRVHRISGATMIRAVRELHERVAYRQILREVHEALDLGQRRIAPRDPVPARLSRPPGSTEHVLYWLSPAPNSFLAVVYSRSVLLADDAERIAAHAHALRSAVRPGQFEILLVVNGLVSQSMQDRLGRSIGSRPLVHHQVGFAQSVHKALLQLERRLVGQREEGDPSGLGERVRRELLDQHAAFVSEMRQSLAALAREIQPGRVATSPGTNTDFLVAEGGLDSGPLPGPVHRRFRDAFAVLETVTRRVVGRTSNRGTAATSQDLNILGCATMVSKLTEEFREAVTAWAGTALPGAPSEHQLGELRRICREYEHSVEVLPVHLLGGADPRHALTPARTVEGLAAEVWGTLSGAAVA